MALDDVARLIEEKDGSAQRVHAALHDLYFGDRAERPSPADLGEKLRLQLTDRGLDHSPADEVVLAVAAEVDPDGGEFAGDPEEFARRFLEHERWTPPAAEPAVAAPAFTEVDGFARDDAGRLFLADRTTEVFEHTGYPGQGVFYDRQNQLYQRGLPYVPPVQVDGFLKLASGQLVLADGTTEVFEHTGYPGQAVFYDRQNRLYQHGLPYATFTEVDGFARDGAGRLFLADRTTEVFEHTGYPGQAVYYDRQNALYQHGLPYAPAVAAEPEQVNLATDARIAELLNSETNHDELLRAVAAEELVITFDDEDVDSFTAEHFVNID